MTAPGQTSTTAPSAENPPLPPCSHLRKVNRWEDTSMPLSHPVPPICLWRGEQNEPPCFRALFLSVALSCSFLKCTDAFPCLGFNKFDSPPATQQVTMGWPSRKLLPTTRTVYPTTHPPLEISQALRREQITAPWQQFPWVSRSPSQLASPKKPFTQAVVALPPPPVCWFLVPAPSRMGWHVPQELELFYFKNSN